MAKKRNTLMYWFLFIIMVLIICIIVYGYNSGSCKINKKYSCDSDFCLLKEFDVHLEGRVKNEINSVLANTQLQKRVNIETFPETIFNCAMPNKKGVTISTTNLVKYAPNLIHFYQNELRDIVSSQLQLKLQTTDLTLPTTCAILIYENEGDWINWHYDHNYYDGRFFTVLVPITNSETCTEFQFKNDKNEIKSVNLTNNNSICFEGNYLYHRASKLCKNQRRIILSCQYVTNNRMNSLNKLRLKLKDFAYIGKLGF